MLAAEAGAAAYLMPLIRFLDTHGSTAWRLLATDVAAKRFDEAGIRCYARIDKNSGEPQLDALLDGWRFGVALVSATGAMAEQAACGLGRRLGAFTIGYVDAFTPCLPRFKCGTEFVLPDEILLIDSVMADEAVQEGLPRERMRVVGQPAWEHVQPLPPVSPKHVLFVGQPVRRHYGTTLGYDEHSAWRMVLECRRRHPASIDELGYAAHPDQDALQPEMEKGNQEAGLVTVERQAAAALPLYGTVLGMFTSLLVDAVLAEREAISVQPGAPGRDICSLSRRGLIDRAGDPDGLALFLERRQSRPAGSILRRSLNGSLARLRALVEARA